MLKKYLLVTSVIFHFIFLVSLFWIVPFFVNAKKGGEEWFETFQNPEVGTILGVSTMTKEGYKYNGYAIDLEGETIYTTGSADNTYQVGDKVDLSITKHPYEPLNTLMITILEVSR